MLETLKAYRDALSGLWLRAGLSVVLSGLSGLLEGLALLTLIPLVNLGVSRGTNGRRFFHWLELAGFRPSQLLYLLLGVFVGAGVLSAALRLIADASLLRLRVGLEESLRKRIVRVIVRMRWSEFHGMRLGGISESMLLEGFWVAMGAYSLLQSISALLVAVAFLGIACLISMPMTLVTVGFGAFVLIAYKTVKGKASRYSEAWSKIATSIGDQIGDIFGSLKFFKSTGLAPQAERNVNEIIIEYRRAYFLSQIYANVTRFLFEAGGVLFVGAFLGLVLLLTKQAIAEAIVFLAVFYRLAPRFFAVHDGFYQAHTCRSWFVAWKARYDLAAAYQDFNQGTRTPVFRDALRVHDVYFRYPRSNRPAVTDIDWDLKPGECLALVGETGSGKTTMLDLVTGLLKPTHGQITIDGVPLDELDLDAWRRHIGLVLQESPVFHGTVLENIAWWEANPDREKARRCAELAQVWEFIQTLPQALDTQIGEKGGRLSGGQRQQIALARALYRDPWLLILDEPTSALDGQSEAKILSSLSGLKGRFAILIVTHRLKPVRIADEIVVLDRGGIQERGIWEELISRRDGAFHRMVELQGVANQL